MTTSDAHHLINGHGLLYYRYLTNRRFYFYAIISDFTITNFINTPSGRHVEPIDTDFLLRNLCIDSFVK